MDWDKVTPLLQAKLDPANVRPAKSFGPKGDYIEGWHSMAEANRIFGFGEWDYHITDCRVVSERPRDIGRDKKPGFGVSYVATVQVVVGQVRRQDVGAGHGYDLDCGLAHESAIKEAVTDALKRALRSFGNPFGLALYDKSRENVGVDLPPFNAQAAADRIIGSVKRQKTIQNLETLYRNERETIAEIKAASAEIHERVMAEFKAAKATATDDPAMQAPPMAVE